MAIEPRLVPVLTPQQDWQQDWHPEHLIRAQLMTQDARGTVRECWMQVAVTQHALEAAYCDILGEAKNQALWGCLDFARKNGCIPLAYRLVKQTWDPQLQMYSRGIPVRIGLQHQVWFPIIGSGVDDPVHIPFLTWDQLFTVVWDRIRVRNAQVVFDLPDDDDPFAKCPVCTHRKVDDPFFHWGKAGGKAA